MVACGTNNVLLSLPMLGPGNTMEVSNSTISKYHRSSVVAVAEWLRPGLIICYHLYHCLAQVRAALTPLMEDGLPMLGPKGFRTCDTAN